MQLYPKTSAELVLDLIAASNPGLPFPLTPATAFVGPPTVIAVVPPSIANTSARVSSKPSGGYGGSKVVTYRRVNLADLFKNITPNVRKYSATGDAGGSPFTIYTLLPFLNDLYGLKLTTDDVNDGAFPAYSTITEGGVSKKVSSLTMTAKATSSAFTGSVLIRTQAGQRELSSAITKGELNGRLYPGGNDFVTVTKDRLDCMGYGIDWTEMMLSPVAAWSNQQAFNLFTAWPIGGAQNTMIATEQQKFFDVINNQLGTSLTVGHQTTTPGTRWNLVGAVPLLITLPNVNYPEANSKDYNRMIVIPLLVGHTWAAGRMYLHFNI